MQLEENSILVKLSLSIYFGVYVLLWQRVTSSYKTRKTNSDFCLKFSADEAHTKKSG